MSISFQKMEDMRSHCEVYGNTTILNAKDRQLPKYKTRLWQRYEFYPNNTAIKEILKFIPFLQDHRLPPNHSSLSKGEL